MWTARCKDFLSAAETGSFSRPAGAMGYTSSGVSQLVAAPEGELVFTLPRRSRRGVSPTPGGTALLPAVRAMLGQEAFIMPAPGLALPSLGQASPLVLAFVRHAVEFLSRAEG